MDLITKHLDIWTEAQVVKTKGGRGRGKKANDHYGIKKLRELILELAVRGKLVLQDSNDEPANVLLAKIAEEKARLVKEKKIKKQKKLPEISEDEKPFALPEGWEWVRFTNLSVIERGGSPRPIKAYLTDDPDGLNWIKIGDTEKGGKFITSTKEKIRREGLKKTRMVYPGDFLLTNSMSFGRPYITQIEGCIHDGWLRIHPFAALNSNFLYHFLSSTYVSIFFKAAAAGAVVLNLNADKVRNLPIPLPPLAEQHRIVAKVVELMALCDQLEQQQTASQTTLQTLRDTVLTSLTNTTNPTEFSETWQRISTNFATLFNTEQSIDQLKQTILQLAVMGKLVPQNPKDEPASILLEKIAQEKATLIKQGKIKKQKKLPEIGEEKNAFDLPVGWKRSSLSHLGVFSGGKTPSKQKKVFWDGDIPWVTPKDMKTPKIIGSQDHVTSVALDNGLTLYDSESIFFVVRSGILRHSFPVAISKVPCTVNQDLKVLSLYSKEIAPYVYLMMKGFEQYILDKLTKIGMTVESVKFAEFSQHYFLLPPLAEQHRIVAKVDKFMTLCDTLKSRLKENQSTQVHLADTIVQQAVS